MKGIRLLLLTLFLPAIGFAQVSCIPVFPKANDDVTITFNATLGNGALAGTAPVYAHMGLITDKSTAPNDWKYVQTTWGEDDPVGLMTNAGPDLWTKSFNIRNFFNVPAGEEILELAFVFRNINGSIVGRATDGGDIFYPVYPDNIGLHTAIIKPAVATLLTSAGETFDVQAATTQSATLRLLDNGNQIATTTGTLLETTVTASSGVHTVEFIAEAGMESDTSSFIYIAPVTQAPENPPAGTEYGINYIDDQTVRLQLYAPGKEVIHVIGDFNDWTPDNNYQMKRNVLGNIWWIEIDGLQPGQLYRFQYLVDGALRIADPLSTLVLDPWNDPYIPAVTYPNLPAYPTGKTFGIVSVLQTAQQPFDWQATGYIPPKTTDLVIYELLLRDFLERHDYPTLLDTLDYLDRLGITAIELMPVNEFDGNISWGYNPAFHKALDKYYGTTEDFKRFIDACHERGIAVILDVVFNHVTGASPLAQLYWDAVNNRPAINNPWLNPIPKHDFNVFNDFNHESALTKIYVKNCLKYWLSEFRIDGFRFDLSKGFTQKNTLGDVGAWGQYDGSRVAILKDYADYCWSVNPDTYVILEHFANNPEEKILAEYGMLIWGKMYTEYKDIARGYNGDLNWASYKQRGWVMPHLITYVESHDEERVAFECLTKGNSSDPTYNIQSPIVAMRRLEMMNNLFYTLPGPKMLWEFGELGYDISIFQCTNGTLGDCRLDPKPIRWDYYDDPYRRRLFDVTAALLHLRTNYDVFETTDFTINLASGQVRSIFLNDPAMNVAVVANVSITEATSTLDFQHTGDWYEYYTGDTLNVSNTSTELTLGPGEYRLYLDQFVAVPAGLNTTPIREPKGPVRAAVLYPNPVQEQLNLALLLDKNSDIQITIYDITGRRMDNIWSGDLPAGEQQFQVNTGDWGSGIYFVQISDASGTSLVRKFVK
ncbi:MAG: T9SS type A sorting domain-containing protein [Bacteroidetes bacterium]|nr:MAG: T9SS type A sorting domain-containing protein [Bacteroidota bacterium]